MDIINLIKKISRSYDRPGIVETKVLDIIVNNVIDLANQQIKCIIQLH